MNLDLKTGASRSKNAFLMESEHVCFKCKTSYAASVVICMKCGVNLQTGMEIQTVRPPPPEASPPNDAGAEETVEAPLTGRERILQFIAEWTPGLLRPAVMIGSLLLAAVGFCLVVLCFVVLTLGAALSAFPIGALGVIAYGQAVSWMMSGDFRLLHDAFLDFESRHWTFFFAALFLPFAAGIAAMKMAAGQG